MMKYLFKHAHLIIDDHKEYLDGALLIDGEHIEDVFLNSNKLNIDETEYQVIDTTDLIIMPGFFDSHFHGISNISFDEASKEDMEKAALEIAKSGTTSFIPSISFALDVDKYDRQIDVMNSFVSKASRMVGFHIEGPFLSPKYLASSYAEKLKMPSTNLVKDILSKTNKLKQMTIAYELDGAKEIGRLLHENNVKVMVGHSDAISSDLDENVDGITHIFNGMRPLNHKTDSLVNLAFENNHYVELIADGHHVNNSCLRLILNNINSDKIILISDSSVARGLKDGEYEFLGRTCIKEGTSFKTKEGSFAGSVVSINDEIKLLRGLGAKYTDLLKYSSLNAFKFYGLDKLYGSLIKGKSSDIVIMDKDLNIKNVLVQGKLIY